MEKSTRPEPEFGIMALEDDPASNAVFVRYLAPGEATPAVEPLDRPLAT